MNNMNANNNNGFTLANPNLRQHNMAFGWGFGAVLPPLALLYLTTANQQNCSTCANYKPSSTTNSDDFFAVGHGYEKLFAMDTRKK